MPNRIGITQRLVRNEQTGEVMDALDIQWAQLFETFGWLLIPLPSGMPPQALLDALSLDGLILSGGNDLTQNAPEDPLSQRRDQFESALIATAIQRQLPIFGVCRGMQMLVSYFGGTVTSVPHHAGTTHRILAISGQDFPGEVNSFHHYGITRLPEGLVALAAAEDGTIEAMQHKTLPIAAQMWHPERPPCSEEAPWLHGFFTHRASLSSEATPQPSNPV